MDNSKSDIGLVYNKKILETGTSNLLFIKNNKIYTPKKIIMKAILLNFLKVKLKK
jgi:branched-subunit amino acid aminotransferase/4-amino-4-deoxychorismate lyase